MKMRKAIGFAMFWFALGMFIMLFLTNNLIAVLIIFILLLLGYQLFSC